VAWPGRMSRPISAPARATAAATRKAARIPLANVAWLISVITRATETAKGYDRTAVHEITDAVDVSERAARLAEEEPLTAARHAPTWPATGPRY
jgi:hypothetical protein